MTLRGKISNWWEGKKEDRREKRTIIEVETPDGIVRDKMKNFNLVYLTDRETGLPDFKLCGVGSEFSHSLPMVISTGKTTTIIMQPQYDYYYTDLLDEDRRIDEDRYRINGNYYVRTLFPMSFLQQHNYRISTEQILSGFDTAKQEVISGKLKLK